MFPPSDVFGSDPFAQSANDDPFTSPTGSLSQADPFSLVRKEPLSPQTDSQSQTNNFPSSDPFSLSQDASKHSLDPFNMEAASVPSDLFKKDPFSRPYERTQELGISKPQPPKPSAASSAFEDSFGEPFAPPTQNQTTSPPLSPVSADPFALQTGSSDQKQMSQQKDPFGAEGLPASVASQPNNIDPFGSFSFGNSQKQETSTDDRFAALRLLDDETPSTSMFPTASAAPDINKATAAFSDPFDVFGSSASTQSQNHQISAFNSAIVPSSAISMSDPFAALSNVQAVPPAEQQKARDPSAQIPTSFPVAGNSSGPFESGRNTAGDLFGSQQPSQSLVGFNQPTMTSRIGNVVDGHPVNAESLFVTTVAFGGQNDPYLDSQPSVSAAVTGVSDPFASLSLGATTMQPNLHMASTDPFSMFSTQGTKSRSATAISQIQPQPEKSNSVDPFGSSLGGDLFSTVPSSSPQVTFIQGPGGLGNDPFSSLGEVPQPQTTAFSHSTAIDPFSTLNASKGQMSPTLRGSRSTGSIGIRNPPSSTNPFLASNTTLPTSSAVNPFADHPSVRSTVQQEQQRQATVVSINLIKYD